MGLVVEVGLRGPEAALGGGMGMWGTFSISMGDGSIGVGFDREDGEEVDFNDRMLSEFC